MYSDEDISSAVAAGVLTEEAATAFRAHVAALRNAAAVDEESFRLITGFNDIFVAIACALLLASLGWIGGALAPWLGAAIVAATAWALSEFFVRKRRMALPAILLLLAIVGGVVAACVLAMGKSTLGLVVAAFAGAGIAWLHWRRFHVPITVAAGIASAVGCLIALTVVTVPEAARWINTISLVSGLLVFALALRWDATDTARETRRSDVAFWLHLLAAPLIVRPVFDALGTSPGQATLVQAGAVVALYVVIALVSLCIDRRALMVSALTYVLYVFSALLNKYGFVSMSLAITALVVGSALLLLSAFWHASRARVLGWVPTALQKRLAPLR
jgi:hypothetical protein